MADTSTFSGAMQTKFIGPIRDTLHSGKVLLFGSGDNNPAGDDANPEGFKGILGSSENIDFVGNEFRIPYKVNRNQAVGFRSEGEALPSPGASKYTYLTEPMRYAYGAFNITGQLMKASETNEGAFKSAFKQEMEDVTLTSKVDHNRAAWGDGSGKFADVRTAYTAPGTGVIDVSSTVNFRGSEIVDIVSAAGAVISNAHTITGVDRLNRTVTVTPVPVANLTTAHFFVRASGNSTIAVPNNSQNREIQGLTSIVASTGTLHGVNPTTVPSWASYQRAVAGSIGDAEVRLALSTVGFESGADIENDANFALISTRGLRDRYATTLLSLKQFTDSSSTTLQGGFKVLNFDGLNWFTDDQCPIGTMVGLTMDNLFWAQMGDWDWMDKDGDVLKAEPGRDRYTAVLYKYCQLGTTARNRQFRLTGGTDDVR